MSLRLKLRNRQENAIATGYVTKKEDLQESETLPLSFVENDHVECDLAIESALVYQEYRDQRPL